MDRDLTDREGPSDIPGGGDLRAYKFEVEFDARGHDEAELVVPDSFQLLYDGTRWWVVSVVWQAETRDYPIPAKYVGTIGDE